MTQARWPNMDPERRCMKPVLWSAADKAAWTRARVAGDILEPGGPASRWRPATVRKAESCYGRFQTWLTCSGLDVPDDRPAAGVTRDNVLGYIQALRELNASMTVSWRINGLHDMVIVLNPAGDFSWLARIACNLEAQSAPSRDKASRVVPTDELKRLGLRIMLKAGKERCPEAVAVPRQLGLMIDLLAVVPIRRKNLASIRIDVHLRRVGEHFRLVIPPEEMKNHRSLDVPIPGVPHGRTRAPLDRRSAGSPHLGQEPPQPFGGPASDALWVSRHGSRLHGEAIYKRVREATHKQFGHSISVQLFRLRSNDNRKR